MPPADQDGREERSYSTERRGKCEKSTSPIFVPHLLIMFRKQHPCPFHHAAIGRRIPEPSVGKKGSSSDQQYALALLSPLEPTAQERLFVLKVLK